MVPSTVNHSVVNGLSMYYEIYGKGFPLVLIHGGGSTIQSNFEKIIPYLAKKNMIIAMELQAHGRTTDRQTDTSFEQDADDVFQLLTNLKIKQANFLGFSNGATTTMQIAIRHPEIVHKMILASPLAKRDGVPNGFWDFMNTASLDNMPEKLKEYYLKVNPSLEGLKNMHDKDAKRVVNFKDLSDKQIQSIEAPTLIIIGDQDVILPEHALELHKQIQNSNLAIIPGQHGEYIGEITTINPKDENHIVSLPIIEKFLIVISS